MISGGQARLSVLTHWQRLALLAGFLLLVILRIPQAWAHGRFLDEEATVFFAYAWHHPGLDALFRPFAGYWNLGANATTLLAVHLVKGGIVPLDYVPYLTMTMALAVQALPAVLILTGRAAWLQTRTTVIAALLTLAIAPGIEEVFFNVLHIQFHLALCVALILALDPPQRTRARICYGLLLFTAPLCGPGVLAFLPLLVLRALIDRDRRRMEQVIALAAGGAIQMLLFFGANPLRGRHASPGLVLAALFTRLIVMPTLGFGQATRIGVAIYDSYASGGFGSLLAAAAAILFFGTLLVVAARRRDGTVWMLLASLTIAMASLGFGMIMTKPDDVFNTDAERYTFIPLVLLLLVLIVMAVQSRSKARWACALFLLLTLVTGIDRYRRPLPGLSEGPSWPAEVAAWRRDHHHPMAVWPRPWVADLSDEAHTCTPIGPALRDSAEPRYCESGWAAGFYRAQRAR